MAAGRVLIVGANGFLGSRAVRRFLAAGWAVHGFGPAPVVDLLEPWRGRIGEHAGSVTDPGAVAAALEAAQPDVLLSFAAHGEGGAGLMRSGEAAPDRAFAVNVEGLRVLLQACAAAGVRRVLWASSTTVFGPASEYPGPVDEDAPPRPRTVYGLTKLLAEEVSAFVRRRDGLDVCAVRPPLVFGPGRWYGGAAGVLDALIAAAARGEATSLSVPEGRFDLMHGDDVAEAFLHLARHAAPLPPVLHVNGFATDYAEIAAALARLRPGFRPVLDHVPAPAYPLITAGRVAQETGFHPRLGLADALRATMEEIAA